MDWQSMFFQDWSGIVRAVLVGIILFLRISGKRPLAKLNALDLVVTMALGSTLSAIFLQESVALAEGATALGLLCAVSGRLCVGALAGLPTLFAPNRRCLLAMESLVIRL